MSGLSSQPRLLKGAFVDSNVLAFPPLIVPFQFNPEQIRRRRSARIATPPSRRGREERQPLDEGLGEAQTTTTPPETMSIDVRLDATDALEEGDPIAAEFGVLPTLSALELMILPRSESFFGGLLGLSADLGFGDRSSHAGADLRLGPPAGLGGAHHRPRRPGGRVQPEPHPQPRDRLGVACR